MMLKFGKLPATHDPRDLRFAAYTDLATVLPAVPTTFGYNRLLPHWGMLGNDRYGDCVWAGAAHEEMIWNAEGKHPVTFSDASVLGDYSAVTGFNPNDPNSDRGTNVRDAANYRLNTGVHDAGGLAHKIGAYVALAPGNVGHVTAAAYLFGAVGLGIQVPASAMNQFNAGQAWDVVPGSAIEGGHYVPYIGHDANNLYVVTWGRVQKMTPRFFSTYCDEAYAYLTSEDLSIYGVSPEGFNMAQLRADLAAVRG